MPRPPLPLHRRRSVRLPVSLTEQEAADVEALADSWGCSKAEAMRRSVRQALGVLEPALGGAQ